MGDYIKGFIAMFGGKMKYNVSSMYFRTGEKKWLFQINKATIPFGLFSLIPV